MADEELIYRITRAVYGRLGASASQTDVEGIVTDVYKAVEPLVGSGGSTSKNEPSESSSSRLIVSVFGLDQPGIVATVSGVLAEAGCTIVDINQTVVQGKFAMVVVSDISGAKESAAALKERLKKEGENLGVRIYAQREDLFNAMHRV